MRKGDSPDIEKVRAFVKYLRENRHPRLKVHSQPDKKRRRDIDAIAGPFAIEHTRIETIKNQSRDSDYFLRAIKDIEPEFKGKVPFHLVIEFAYNAVRRRQKQKWEGIRDAMRLWIINKAPALPDGPHIIRDVPGIPFEFKVNKRSKTARPGVYFQRSTPRDDSLHERIKEQLYRKARKLEPYKVKGKKTVLLVESVDEALMSSNLMLNAIRHALGGALPRGVDYLWYMDGHEIDDPRFYDFTDALKVRDS